MLLSLLSLLLLATVDAKVVVRVDTARTYQVFDGLGISQAFQRARQIYGSDGLSEAGSARVLNLLFGNRTGAGLTILRNGIGSSSVGGGYDVMSSIAPEPPGTNGTVLEASWWNSSIPRYVFDGDDSGQMRLTRDALKRGLRTVYADAWSAPGWMKSNFNDSGGGHLCGVAGVGDCAQGDMRKAYAEYLVQYLRFWEDAGVTVDVLGFLNEPDWNVTYASMLSTGNQAGDFLKIFAPILHASNLTTKPKITCCEGTGWEASREQLSGLKNARAKSLFDIATSHGYTSPPSLPLETSKKVWQTEWADLDSGIPTLDWFRNGSAGEGLTWALRIQDAFVKSNVSAFLGWIGAGNTTTNSALILLHGDEIRVSKRLWAFGQFSRFVRPGAFRVQADIIPIFYNTTSGNITATTTISQKDFHVSAFAQPNNAGTIVQVINNSGEDDCIQIDGVSTTGAILRRYLTNELYDITKINIETHRNPELAKPEECRGDVVGPVPARSMVSFVVERLVPLVL